MVSNTDSHSGRVLAAIAAGGALGGPARYGLGLAFPTTPHTFPATTFAINVSGSFLLALLVVLILDVWPPTIYVRPFLCVGFLGAYTTFSTWMVDTDRLISAGAWGTAVANLVLSLVAGLGA
ncbi:CrcB family protein, partial [Catenulispora sp. NF23]|uniref:fluoride efflux transporter FluC n=1 Tax=Catenulispora pinistramenti TaxID=2705254 RepID=UPI001BA7EA0C